MAEDRKPERAKQEKTTWKPEVRKTPLDPPEDEHSFDRQRDDVAEDITDPRHGFTPKPG